VSLFRCKCGCCRVVSPNMRIYDRICCRELKGVLAFMKEEMSVVTCITKHPRFESDVLDYKGFLRSMKSRLNGPNKDSNQDQVQQDYRLFKAGTDQERIFKCSGAFVRWIFDRIGWTDRVPIPACVMDRIRKTHAPKAGPAYFQPFRASKPCNFGVHCRKAILQSK
jgi:hypothetical protein